jgi:hypothetical protein
MKKLKIKKEKSINLEVFLDLYEKFISVTNWSKEKHQRFDEVNEYLSKHEVRIKRVKPHSKYNLCEGTNSFTILKVPSDQLGSLFKFRDEWVLVRCTSYTQGGWSQYSNEVYRFEGSFTFEELEAIKKRFGHWFILK